MDAPALLYAAAPLVVVGEARVSHPFSPGRVQIIRSRRRRVALSAEIDLAPAVAVAPGERVRACARLVVVNDARQQSPQTREARGRGAQLQQLLLVRVLHLHRGGDEEG